MTLKLGYQPVYATSHLVTRILDLFMERLNICQNQKKIEIITLFFDLTTSQS